MNSAGPINSLDEVFADQQIIHRGMELSLRVYPVSVQLGLAKAS